MMSRSRSDVVVVPPPTPMMPKSKRVPVLILSWIDVGLGLQSSVIMDTGKEAAASPLTIAYCRTMENKSGTLGGYC